MEEKKLMTFKELLLEETECSFKFNINSEDTTYNLFDGRILFTGIGGNPTYMEAGAIAKLIDDLVYKVEED